MGYTTEFEGKIAIDPPLSEEEREFLVDFASDEHDGCEYPRSYYCQWVPTDDGAAIEWDGNEKFYNALEWMDYLMKNFLNKDRICDLPFLQGHACNGSILAQGEEMSDRWKLVVENNVVRRVGLE